MQFEEQSLVDGRIREVKFLQIRGTSVAATLPHFWSSAGTKLYLEININIYKFMI